MKSKGCKNKEIRGRTISYPVPGFQNDVVKLLQKFVATKSIRFEEFLKVWRESNFSLVHLGRTALRESREFLEECFKILLKYIMPPFNLQVRVGGLYMIYSMYYTQHIKMKPRKVRIPLSCWPNFCELRQEVTESQHLDAVYIIRKLIGDRAFMLCAYPTHLSVDEVYLFEDGRETSAVTSLERSSGLGEAVGLLTQIQDEDNLGQLRAVHEKYHQLKCEFNASRGGSSDSPGSSLDLIKPDVTKTVLDIINPPRKTAQITRTNIQTNSDGYSSDRALKIKQLKEVASSSKVKAAFTSAGNKKNDNEEGWFVRKRGRPHALPSNLKTKTPPKATTEESSESENNTDSNERKKPRKSEPKKIVPYHDDDDYEPDEPVKVPNKRSQPARRKRSYQSTDDENSPTKKSLRSSNKETRRTNSLDDDSDLTPQKQTPSKKSPHSAKKGAATIDQNKVQPGSFVGIQPFRQNRRTPVIGKVVTNDKPDSIEVVYYNGDFDTTWTQISAIKKDDSEGKPLVQSVKRKNIILANVVLTKTGRLVASSKMALKKAMKLA